MASSVPVVLHSGAEPTTSTPMAAAAKHMTPAQRAVAVKRGLLKARPGKAASGGLDPTYNPLQILAGPNLAKAIQAIVGGSVNPQLADIAATHKQEVSDAGELSDRALGYAKFLAAQGQQGLTNQQSIDSTLLTNLKGAAADTQTAIGAAGDQATASLGTAGPGDAASRIAAIIAAQKGNAAQSAQGYQDAGSSQGATAQTLMNGLNDAGSLSGAENQKSIAYNLQQNLGKLSDARQKIKASIPGIYEKALVDLRDQGYQQFATNQGLDIKNAQLVSAGQQAAARLGVAQQNADTSAGGLAERTRHDQAQETISQQRAAQAARTKAQQKGWNGLTPSEQHTIEAGNAKVRDRIDAAMLDAQHLPTTDSKGKTLAPGYWNPATIVQSLQSRYTGPFAHLVALAAYTRSQNHGYLTPQVFQMLKQAGVGVPGDWIRNVGPVAAPGTGGGGTRPT